MYYVWSFIPNLKWYVCEDVPYFSLIQARIVRERIVKICGLNSIILPY